MDPKSPFNGLKTLGTGVSWGLGLLLVQLIRPSFEDDRSMFLPG